MHFRSQLSPPRAKGSIIVALPRPTRARTSVSHGLTGAETDNCGVFVCLCYYAILEGCAYHWLLVVQSPTVSGVWTAKASSQVVHGLSSSSFLGRTRGGGRAKPRGQINHLAIFPQWKKKEKKCVCATSPTYLTPLFWTGGGARRRRLLITRTLVHQFLGDTWILPLSAKLCGRYWFWHQSCTHNNGAAEVRVVPARPKAWFASQRQISKYSPRKYLPISTDNSSVLRPASASKAASHYEFWPTCGCMQLFRARADTHASTNVRACVRACGCVKERKHLTGVSFSELTLLSFSYCDRCVCPRPRSPVKIKLHSQVLKIIVYNARQQNLTTHFYFVPWPQRPRCVWKWHCCENYNQDNFISYPMHIRRVTLATFSLISFHLLQVFAQSFQMLMGFLDTTLTVMD